MKSIPTYIQEPLLARENQEDYNYMLELTTAALKDHPEDRECLLCWHIGFLRSANRLDECVSIATEVAPTINDRDYLENIIRMKAYALETMNKKEEAIEVYKELYEKSNNSLDLKNIAGLYEELGDEENALYYLEIISNDEDDVEACEKILAKYEKKKDYEKAYHYAVRCARIDPFQGDYFWSCAGRHLALMNKLEEAKFHFKMVIKLNPDFADAYYLLGESYQHSDDPYRAMDNYYKALKLQPDFPEVYNNLGVIKYTEDSDIKKAIELLETALEQKPSDELKVTLFTNLIRLNKRICNYDRQSYYNAKLLTQLGFPAEFITGDDIDNDDNDDEDYDEENDEENDIL